jgi:hypothetical protein
MAADTTDQFEESDEPRPLAPAERAKDSKGVMRLETVRFYGLFRKYLDLGEKRSYRKFTQQEGRSRTYIERVA